MAQLTPKQREILDRENRILEVARRMLIERGYLGLNMDRIAETIEYSKGTVYQHFSCKEDVLLALVNRAMERRADLFERGAAFEGLPRERLAAVGMASELFVRLHPDHFQVEQALRIGSIWEKTSEDRRQLMRSCEGRCVAIVSGIVRTAVERGDLTLPEGRSPEDMVFGLWSITYGAHTIQATSSPLAELGIGDAFDTLWWNISSLLDGCGWRPLTTEHDYEATRRRIANEIFAKEFASLGQ